MAKRLFDMLVALVGLVAVFPVTVLAMFLVKISSKGPVIYRARRCGVGGREFDMYKIRTMHVVDGGASRVKITAAGDKRVFAAGRLIRKLKIDELPQLWNVIKGDMSLVGPRPEDPEIVRKYYKGWELDTLSVRPGVASPGSIFNYTHGEHYIDPKEPEGSYARAFLPRKLALDAIYVRKASLLYDVRIIGRTIAAVILVALGRSAFSLPPEAVEASQVFDLEY